MRQRPKITLIKTIFLIHHINIEKNQKLNYKSIENPDKYDSKEYTKNSYQ